MSEPRSFTQQQLQIIALRNRLKKYGVHCGKRQLFWVYYQGSHGPCKEWFFTQREAIARAEEIAEQSRKVAT